MHLVYDAIRWLALLEGSLVLGLAVFVLRMYWYANTLQNKLPDRIPGALPYHVAVIASSHIIMLIWLEYRIAFRIDNNIDHIAYETVLAIFVYSLTAFAMIDMLKYQQLRIHKLLKPKSYAKLQN